MCCSNCAVRYLELKIPPLVLSVIFAAAIIAVGEYAPFANQPFPGHRWVAIASVSIGIAIAVAGVVQFRIAKTSVNPLDPSRASRIVESGVFRFSRNPMYLGMAIGLFGVAAWRSTLLGYALVPLFCMYLTEFQIKPEERALRAVFGNEFLVYLAKVRRWI